MKHPTCDRRLFLVANATIGILRFAGCRQMSIMNDFEKSPPMVTVETGRLLGSRVGSINSFKRVPYAENPFSPANRFKAPQPVAMWNGERDAGHFGPMPPQPSRTRDGGLAGAADDLTLNIWASSDAYHAPVLVWFPGGAFYRVDASEGMMEAVSQVTASSWQP